MTKEISEHQYYTTYRLLATRLNRHQIKFEMVATLKDEIVGQSGAMILTVADVRNMLKEFEEIESENKERALALGISQPIE